MSFLTALIDALSVLTSYIILSLRVGYVDLATVISVLLAAESLPSVVIFTPFTVPVVVIAPLTDRGEFN